MWQRRGDWKKLVLLREKLCTEEQTITARAESHIGDGDRQQQGTTKLPNHCQMVSVIQHRIKSDSRRAIIQLSRRELSPPENDSAPIPPHAHSG